VVQDDESGIFQAPSIERGSFRTFTNQNNTEGKSGTDEAFSDTYLTWPVWLVMTRSFKERETSRLFPSPIPSPISAIFAMSRNSVSFSSTRARATRVMLVFLIVWPWSLDWAEEVRGRELRFASQPAAEGRFCLVFGGTIALDDFLQGLQKRETPTGIEFRRGSRSVAYFPENITIAIDAFGASCKQKKDPTEPTAEFMSSLHLDVFWKDGVHVKPVREFSQKAPVPKDVDDLTSSLPKMKMWTYALSVHDDGIPLTSHIIVVISSSGGHTVARLSAQI